MGGKLSFCSSYSGSSNSPIGGKFLIGILSILSSRRDRAERVHALEHVSAADLLHEFIEKTEGQLFRDHIGHEERATLRFRHGVELFDQFRFYFRTREVA